MERPADCVARGMFGNMHTVVAHPLLMVVDDDADLLWLMQHALQQDGFAVRASAEVPGVEAVRGAHPAALILDMEVGRARGDQACAKMKHAEGLAGLPVVLISGRPVEELREAAVRCGADAYLAKPFRMRDLVRMAERLVPRTAV